MFASRTVLFALASILTFFTTFSVLPQERAVYQEPDALEARVAALEETVADLAARVELLESQPVTSTAASIVATAELTPPVAVASDALVETEPLHSDDYEPVLQEVEPIGCEYDPFQDADSCSRLSTPELEDRTLSWAQVDESMVMIDTLLVQPTDGKPALKWMVVYLGDDWLFLTDVIFLYDGKRYSIDFDPVTQRYSDVLDGGTVVEGIEVMVDSVETLVDIVTAEDVQVRLAGQKGNIDKTLTEFERNVFLRTLAAYEQRGGQLPENRMQLIELLSQKDAAGNAGQGKAKQ